MKTAISLVAVVAMAMATQSIERGGWDEVNNCFLFWIVGESDVGPVIITLADGGSSSKNRGMMQSVGLKSITSFSN